MMPSLNRYWLIMMFVVGCLMVANGCVMWCTIYLIVFIVMFLLVLAPLAIKVFPQIPKHIVYLNVLKLPSFFENLADPSSVGLNYARNFYHKVAEDVTVGIWHILPKSLEREGLKSTDFDNLLSSEYPIVLYCHGNSFTRASLHRVALYKLLATLNFHVVALDYRGYGDSTGSPTSENGVMTDVVTLYLWLKEKAGPDVPIYVWGHSLGSGIATKAVRFLTEHKKDHPSGLVLEAPFNNLLQAAKGHPLCKLFASLWWFKNVLSDCFQKYNLHLQTDENICHADVPVLIMHAEDDEIVPIDLAIKLHEASKKRPDSFPPVTFHVFPHNRGFQHKYIHKAEELPDILKAFIEGSK